MVLMICKPSKRKGEIVNMFTLGGKLTPKTSLGVIIEKEKVLQGKYHTSKTYFKILYAFPCLSMKYILCVQLFPLEVQKV